MALFTHFRCPVCKNINTAGKWNAKTLEYATKAQKQKFTTKIQHAGNASTLLYMCPDCLQLSRKSSIHGVLASVAEHEPVHLSMRSGTSTLSGPEE